MTQRQKERKKEREESGKASILLHAKAIYNQQYREIVIMAKEVCYEEDQISMLPDAVLCHILSFLPTKYAVGSSVLSKRWRYVWTSVPVIEITDHCLVSAADWKRYKNIEVKEKFMDFVDRVLRLNDTSCLQTFRLTCYHHYDSSRVSKWINAVFMRDIEKLDLHFWEDYLERNRLALVALPLNLFTCKKLVDLKLSNSIFLNVSPAVYLPSLKTLHLDSLQSLDNYFLEKLLAGCPVLEELIINRVVDGINSLSVQSSSLKILRVCTKHNWDEGISYTFDVINLEQLDLSIRMPRQFEANSLTSLVRASLVLCNSFHGLVEMTVHGNTTVEILRNISNTKHLFLSIEVIDALGYTCLNNLPIFCNLTHLEVEIYYCSWPIMPYLLECSPNLISLLLYKETLCDLKACHQQFHVPKCLMLYLEEIKLKAFEGYGDEMEMVRYFLKNSPVLKKMTIIPFLISLDEKSKVQDEVSKLPKGSIDVEIEFL